MDRVVRIKGIVENCYLVKGSPAYLVDTNAPTGRKKLLAALAAEGVDPSDLSHILITHYHADHIGNLAYLHSRSDARIAAGRIDAPCIRGDRPFDPPSDLNRVGKLLRKMPKLVESYQKYEPAPVDLELVGGELLEEIGLEVLALPGHTRGGIGYIDRANRRAFVGDLVSNYFGRVGGPVISASHSLTDIEASLRSLAELDLDYMYPGHGRIVGPGASSLVAEYLAKRFS